MCVNRWDVTMFCSLVGNIVFKRCYVIKLFNISFFIFLYALLCTFVFLSSFYPTFITHVQINMQQRNSSLHINICCLHICRNHLIRCVCVCVCVCLSRCSQFTDLEVAVTGFMAGMYCIYVL